MIHILLLLPTMKLDPLPVKDGHSNTEISKGRLERNNKEASRQWLIGLRVQLLHSSLK